MSPYRRRGQLLLPHALALFLQAWDLQFGRVPHQKTKEHLIGSLYPPFSLVPL